MILAKAPTSESSWLLADWLEFHVLCSEFKSYRITELLRISDEDQESENMNISEQDSLNEQCMEKAVEELEVRTEYLGEAYPFYFNDVGNELVIKDEISPGAYVYLYCLIMSHANRTDVLVSQPPISNADRDLMQICATLAVAGDLNGSAISFGFPRPDHSNFLEALKKAYGLMGEGEVVGEIPAGAPANEKDARIDVIAWGNSPDDGPGKKYILGQVATGANWQEKPIKGEIEPFHNIWFSKSPASTAQASMFIPFCLDVESNATLHDVLHMKTYRFGIIYYRYRLPFYANIGYALAGDEGNNNYIERFDEFDKVETYVNTFCQ